MTIAYSSVTYGDTNDYPISPPVDLNEHFGEDDPREIDEILDGRVSAAKIKGLSESGCERLCQSMTKFKTIFGVKLCSRRAADIEPFKVRLRPNAQPISATQRRYGPAQTAFIESTIKNLDACLLYTSPSPRDQRGSRMPSSA